MTGFFMAVEGPNAVGKTTITGRLAAALRARGTAVHVTTEPSATPLGRLVRSAESYLAGRALALAVAADRHAHLEAEITPALRAGKVVITDRYVQSSLVLQRLDGLGLAEIWSYNAHVAIPGMSVHAAYERDGAAGHPLYMEDDPEVIAAPRATTPRAAGGCSW